MKLQTLRQRAFARELAPVAAQIEGEETIMANDNTLGQLNIELFSELHRLREIDVADVAALDAEVKRSKAVEGIARMVIDNAKTVLSAAEMRAEYSKDATMPRMLMATSAGPDRTLRGATSDGQVNARNTPASRLIARVSVP